MGPTCRTPECRRRQMYQRFSWLITYNLLITPRRPMAIAILYRTLRRSHWSTGRQRFGYRSARYGINDCDSMHTEKHVAEKSSCPEGYPVTAHPTQRLLISGHSARLYRFDSAIAIFTCRRERPCMLKATVWSQSLSKTSTCPRRRASPLTRLSGCADFLIFRNRQLICLTSHLMSCVRAEQRF